MSQSDSDFSLYAYSPSSPKKINEENKEVNSNDVESPEETDNETEIDKKCGFSYSPSYNDRPTSPQYRLTSLQYRPASLAYSPSLDYCPTSPRYSPSTPPKDYGYGSEDMEAEKKTCNDHLKEIYDEGTRMIDVPSPGYCPISPEFSLFSSPYYGYGNANMEAEYNKESGEESVKDEDYYPYGYCDSPYNFLHSSSSYFPTYYCATSPKYCVTSPAYSPSTPKYYGPENMEAENKTCNDHLKKEICDDNSHVEVSEVGLVISAMATLRFLQHDLCGRIRILKDSEVHLKSAIRLVELTGTVAQIEFSQKLIDSVLEEENLVELMEEETKKSSQKDCEARIEQDHAQSEQHKCDASATSLKT